MESNLPWEFLVQIITKLWQKTNFRETSYAVVAYICMKQL